MASALFQLGSDDLAHGADTAYVARQPICSAKGEVEAYEILYRSGNVGSAGDVGLRESSTLLVNTLGAFGLDGLVGKKKAFLNISEDLLLKDCLSMLPQDRVVLEILETVRPTPEVMDAVQKLKAEGYTLALDDYTGQSELEAFLPLVQIVKFEVMGADPTELRPRIARLKAQGKTVLAEKIETHQEYAIWKMIGFQLFQGYFLAKPELVTGKSTTCSHGALVALLSKLQNPETSLDDIEKIIVTDAGLSFRLLRMLHSAAAGVSTKVNSVREAVFFLGLKKAGALATVLLLSNVTRKMPEPLLTALARAYFCESIAKTLKLPQPDAFFTLGLFSMLDAILDTPMESLVSQLPLADDVAEALTHPEEDSEYGRMLRFIQAWERGDMHTVEALYGSSHNLGSKYVQAVVEANEMIANVSES